MPRPCCCSFSPALLPFLFLAFPHNISNSRCLFIRSTLIIVIAVVSIIVDTVQYSARAARVALCRGSIFKDRMTKLATPEYMSTLTYGPSLDFMQSPYMGTYVLTV
jgi:hypothetical protein